MTRSSLGTSINFTRFVATNFVVKRSMLTQHLDRTNNLQNLAPYPRPPTQSHPLASPLPRSRRTIPLRDGSQMGHYGGREPHHLHRRGTETPTHFSRTRMRPLPRYSRVQRAHDRRRRPMERNSSPHLTAVQIQDVFSHGSLHSQGRFAKG